MKILIVNMFDRSGGAARAAYRLHQSLESIGVDSVMLVQIKESDDFKVIDSGGKWRKLVSQIRYVLDCFPLRRYKKRGRALFSPAWLPLSSIANKINSINPDVVHLHWVNGGMLSVEDLLKIKPPIVWSLHDMWAFTGGCHYDDGCGKYRSACGACPTLASVENSDLSNKIFKRKLETYSRIKGMTIVALSKWMKDCAESSSLLNDKPVVNLPNPINIEVFKPLNKEVARTALCLPQGKKLITYGAMSATGDPRKGYKALVEALYQFRERDDIEVVIFGASRPEHGVDTVLPTHYLGRLYDDPTLALLYSAADVMVVPSLQENLSNAIMESLSCGTPVVAFDVGGNGDMVEHKVNGYLATAFSPESLSEGLQWVIDNPSHEQLRIAARSTIAVNFKQDLVANSYRELYESVIEKHKTAIF